MVVLSLMACASTRPYHDKAPTHDECQTAPQDEACIYQQFTSPKGIDFDLAFVEFSDSGNVHDNRLLKKVLQKIDEKSAAPPGGNSAWCGVQKKTVIIPFVHGWKHNADPKDNNVEKFKTLLAQLAEEGMKYSEVPGQSSWQVIGLYMGWRGSPTPLPLLKELTFWNRKNVALEVGKGGVTDVILALDKIEKRCPTQNVLLTLGHSFGGAVVTAALSETLLERVSQQGEQAVQGIGDLVVLLNPAVEANQFLPVVEAMVERDKQGGYPVDQRPIYVILSSEADIATKWMFPAGQFISSVLTKKEVPLKRDYANFWLHEAELQRKTVGEFDPFVTHCVMSDLDARNRNWLSDLWGVIQQANDYSKLTRKGEPVNDSTIWWKLLARPNCPAKRVGLEADRIIAMPPNAPVHIVKTPSEFMLQHSDIFNDAVKSMVFQYLNWSTRGRDYPELTIGQHAFCLNPNGQGESAAECRQSTD